MKIIKRIYNVMLYVLMTVVIALVILLLGVRLVGLEPYTVLSGSMEPKYHVGSMIYVKEVEPTELKVGDPLTFSVNGTVITHQIIEIIDNDNPSDMFFVTQGLTNNVSDGQIPVSSIIGKPVFSIPYLGYIMTYIQNPAGIIGAMCVLVVLLMLSFIIDLVFAEKKDEKSSVNLSDLSDESLDPDEKSEDNIKNKKE